MENIRTATIIEIHNTGSVSVEMDDDLSIVYLMTSDFPNYPRLHDRVRMKDLSEVELRFFSPIAEAEEVRETVEFRIAA